MQKKHHLQLNIGLVIFGAIFIYLVVIAVLYATHNHIETYQVVSGPLSGNGTFTAFIVRDEEIVTSSGSGYVNHFSSDDAKTSKGSLICSVTASSMPISGKVATYEDYEKLSELSAEFAATFDSAQFRDIYTFRQGVSNIVWDVESLASANGTFYLASSDGIVEFSSDGYEKFSEDMLTSDLFNSPDRYVSVLEDRRAVNSGDTLYRLIRSEEWSLYFPISDKMTVELGSRKSVKVKFLRDGNYETGNLSYLMVGDQRYAKLTFSSGLIRYSDLRFVDIEVITNTEIGLKLPLSAVVTKDFYTIPENMLCYAGDDGSEAGFYKIADHSDGTTTNQFISATLYAKGETKQGVSVYYIDMSVFNDNDVLINPSTYEKYTVGETAALQGAYCVNRGYAQFRRIEIIDKDEEYCIISSDTSYGLSRYDYIIKNGADVSENEIVN